MNKHLMNAVALGGALGIFHACQGVSPRAGRLVYGVAHATVGAVYAVQRACKIQCIKLISVYCIHAFSARAGPGEAICCSPVFRGSGAMQRDDEYNRRLEAAMTKDFTQILRSMDWVGRHFYFQRLRLRYPSVAEAVLRIVSPDEHLEGQNTGITPTAAAAQADYEMYRSVAKAADHVVARAAGPPVIPLPRKTGRTRQSTLDEYFERAKRIRRE